MKVVIQIEDGHFRALSEDLVPFEDVRYIRIDDFSPKHNLVAMISFTSDHPEYGDLLYKRETKYKTYTFQVVQIDGETR